MKLTKTCKTLALALALLLVLTACAAKPASGSGTQSVRLQDDFYEAVNAEWLATAVIDADSSSISAFSELNDNKDQKLRDDFAAMMAQPTPTEDAQLAQFLAFYTMTLDYDQRNADGAAPLLPYLEEIQNLNSLSDFENVMADWQKRGMPLPFSMSVNADMKNAEKNAIYFSAPMLFMYSKDLYGGEGTEALAGLYLQQTVMLLQLCGMDEAEATEIAQQAMAFDALIVPYTKTSVESSDFSSMYNPQSFEAFAEGKSLDLSALMQEIFGELPEEVVVTDTAYYDAFSSVVNEDNFEAMRSWLLVTMVNSCSAYLSQDFMAAGSMFDMALSGVTEQSPAEEDAYNLAYSLFGPVVGQYYAATYFSPEAKQEVEGMVDAVIGQYKKMLEENDWLSPETKAKAISKLENMAIHIGYPEKISSIYDDFTITTTAQGGNVLDNNMALMARMWQENLEQWGKPVDRSEWFIPADMVNAFYSPQDNSITFPAGILQAPYYSPDQSASQNYGGIGAVIAHEISHAFDPNGSKFDEKGNLVDWWTPEDYAAYEERTGAMIALFEGVEFEGGTVNGTLTVGENVADAGGLRAAMEVVKNLPDGNLEEFFTNWATVWRIRSTPEDVQLSLTMDVHAPGKLRANMQLQNIDEFYETFGVVEGDGMYRAPENRVRVW